MRLPHRLQGQKVKSQGGAGAYCGGHLAAQLVIHYAASLEVVAQLINYTTFKLTKSQMTYGKTFTSLYFV